LNEAVPELEVRAPAHAPADAPLPRATTAWSAVLWAMAFRWLCFAAMTVLAVWNERRPGVRLDDPLLARIPFVPWIERWNYHLWLVAWLPWLFVVLAKDRARFVRLMIGCGVLSLLRGVCIVMTGLGPVRGDDVNAALDWTPALDRAVVLDILNPLAVFTEASANVWLTKDLFFSGHTASTFLLLLHAWRWPWLRAVVLALHVAVVASVLLGHVHYAIDVVGAWAAAAGVFVVVERWRTSDPRAGAPTRGMH
jgi:hypothetical protein